MLDKTGKKYYSLEVCGLWKVYFSLFQSIFEKEITPCVKVAF